MSAEISRIPEDISHPDAWEERTVITVSVSPWYRIPTGARVRTVNVTSGNTILWDAVRKEQDEPWEKARTRTERSVRKMLRSVSGHLQELSL
jgi:hypothetical protein